MSWSCSQTNRVNPHQCSRSISAHWLSHRPSLCGEDSVRLMGDWRVGQTVDQSGGRLRVACYLVRLFTSCSSSTGFHCWLMVMSCRKKTKTKKVKLVRAQLQQRSRKSLAEWRSGCCSAPLANIMTRMSPEQSGTNLITFLPQWLSNFWLQAVQSACF